MDDQATPKTPAGKGVAPVSSTPPADKDLSQEIERAVAHEPMDQVKCVRVFGGFYRCNWWSRPDGARKGLEYEWAGVVSQYVRKSRFLSATMQTGQLIITEVQPAEVK
jgi:hypothetical protein